MQAQRVAPEDLVCKDKFLVQSTLVDAEITTEDVTSSLVWIYFLLYILYLVAFIAILFILTILTFFYL